MKKTVRIICFALLSFPIALAPQLAIAQPQGVGQPQTPVVQSPNVNQSQDTASQIQGMTGAIKDMQQAISDAEKELQQMINDLNQLRAARPTPPKGNSQQEKDAYYKRRTELQNRVTAKEHQIVATQAKINQLQKQLSDLQQQLSNLQKKAGDSSGKQTPQRAVDTSGKAPPPVKIIPGK
jgi:chromosome segregation ATPase